MCSKMFPDGCAQTSSTPTIQSARVVVFSVGGDGLNDGRLQRFVSERFRVRVFITLYLQTRGEVAERLKAAVC